MTQKNNLPPDATRIAVEGLQIHESLGEGGRSKVHLCTWNGHEAAVKLYKPRAIARHVRKLGGSIAEYEYNRNLSLYNLPTLSTHIAQPLHFVADEHNCLFVQELLRGEVCYFYLRRCKQEHRTIIRDQVARVISVAHEAGIYDVDAHSMNAMIIINESGDPVTKLFDFNLIPFCECPRSPIIALLLRIGVLTPRSRDLRLLRNFFKHDRHHRVLMPYFQQRAEAGQTDAVDPAKSG